MFWGLKITKGNPVFTRVIRLMRKKWAKKNYSLTFTILQTFCTNIKMLVNLNANESRKETHIKFIIIGLSPT